MKNYKGMNDSDKLFVTAAVWLAFAPMIITALSLPMLPDMVTIFYKTVDVEADYYSKYNNLLSVLGSAVPMLIIIISAALKRHDRLQRNFPSLMIVSSMLSICMSGIVLFGVIKQFESSGSVNHISINSLAAFIISLTFSMLFAVMPMIIHSPAFEAGAPRRSLKTTFFFVALERNWAIGAYAFITAGVAATFIYGFFAYIPVAVALIAVFVFLIVSAYTELKRSVETAVYDSIEE